MYMLLCMYEMLSHMAMFLERKNTIVAVNETVEEIFDSKNNKIDYIFLITSCNILFHAKFQSPLILQIMFLVQFFFEIRRKITIDRQILNQN